MKKKILITILSLLFIIIFIITVVYLIKIRNNKVNIKNQQYYVAELYGQKEKIDDNLYLMINLALQKPWSFSHLHHLPKYSRIVSIMFVLNNNQLKESFIFLDRGMFDVNSELIKIASNLEYSDNLLKNIKLSFENLQIEIKKINIKNFEEKNLKNLLNK